MPTVFARRSTFEGHRVARFIDIAAQCAPSVSPALLAAIATVESGLKPLSAYSATTTDVPVSAGNGVAFVIGQLDAGHDVAIGLTGLDAWALASEGLGYVEAFDACSNLAVAGRILDAIWKAAERMGMNPSSAERHTLRVYAARSLARRFTPEVFAERVLVEKQRLLADLPRLTINTGAVPAKSTAVPSQPTVVSPSTKVRAIAPQPVELSASALGRSVPAATGSEPSWNVYGGERPTGMVVFSKQ
jgi:type IV secretion system protein VirB1